MPKTPRRAALLFSALCLAAWPLIGARAVQDADPPEPVEPEDRIELFNGEDLEGWSGDTELWEARDGVLVCKGGDSGVLRTQAQYFEYVLTLKWRWPQTPGDSGVFLHVGQGQGVGAWPACIETQLHHGLAGDFWLLGVGLSQDEDAEPRSTGGRLSRFFEAEEAEPGGWNTMVITCDLGTVSVEVNGELVNTGYHATRTFGAIALQCEGTPIEFKDIALYPIGMQPEE